MGSSVPVAVKEVGSGISGQLAKRLFEAGIAIIDVGPADQPAPTATFGGKPVLVMRAGDACKLDIVTRQRHHSVLELMAHLGPIRIGQPRRQHSRPGETRVLTTAIVQESRQARFGAAVALGVVLLIISLLVNGVITWIQTGGDHDA